MPNPVEPSVRFSCEEQCEVILDVLQERELQDHKWGGPTHDDQHTEADWTRFIADRVATLSRICLASGGSTNPGMAQQSFREIAALAIAAMESDARRKGEVPHA